MADLIDRQAAMDGKISIQRANGVEIYSDEAVPVEYLKALPSAQPERKTGKWETIEGWDGDVMYRCSECGTEFVLIDGTPEENDYRFCPNCGARMEKNDG